MIAVGAEVGWMWLGSLVTGVVVEIHPTSHSIISKGKRIVRHGSDDDPAIVIRHHKGGLVLKLEHEVQAISTENEAKNNRDD
jgi:hypothetical protein